VTRTLLLVAVAVYTLRRDRRLGLGLVRTSKRRDWPGVTKLFRLGAPAGVQFGLETGVFTTATTLISKLGVAPAAAHTLVINFSSFTYMIPMGLSGATAVLVGRRVGARELGEAEIVGWTSIGIGIFLMSLSGIGLALGGGFFASLFTSDAAVIELSRRLLLLVALFQIADGIQAVGGGALRGLGDTRSSMTANLVGYWGVGLPLGYALCFPGGLGVFGFWLGLTVGLFAVAAVVLGRWTWRARRLTAPSIAGIRWWKLEEET
jgi:MATE family multidrug resistance protein